MPCDSQRAEFYRKKGYWTDRLLTDYFEDAVAEFPDKVAVKDDRFGAITYVELHELVLRLAAALQAKGINKGDCFVVALPNWQHVTAFVLALNYLGAVGVHLPITGGTREYEGVIKTSGAKGIVVPAQFNRRDFIELIDPLLASFDNLAIPVSIGSNGNMPGWVTFEELVDGSDAGQLTVDTSMSADDLTTLLFTSGSSGTPKGVMHSSNTIGAMNTTVAPTFSLNSEEVILMGAPLGYSGGFVHGLRLAIYLRATLVLLESWNPDRFIEMLNAEQATFSMITPALLGDVLDHPRLAEIGSELALKVIMCGGSFVGRDLLLRARERLPTAMTTVIWGMTEGLGTACRPDCAMEKRAGTAGRPFLSAELTTIDDEGNETARGESGELVLRSASVFLGYFRQPELTEESFLPGGWLLTGDVGAIDDEGYVSITGRKKDMIIRGSVNISPLEIEEILLEDPRIRDIACVGIPDERLGERVCACVVPEFVSDHHSALSLGDLVDITASAGLAKNKWPQRLVLLEAFPKTSSGKLRRQILQGQVITQLGLNHFEQGQV